MKFMVGLYLRKTILRFFWLFCLVCFCILPTLAHPSVVSPPMFIAHAGGAFNKLTYTNSLEALNMNYKKGYRLFELDYSWTLDGKLVAIHDWDKIFTDMFIVPEGLRIPTQTQFLEIKMKSGLTPLTLEGTLNWAKEKGDVYIVTDIKVENLSGLQKIHTDFDEHQKYLIPQVYSFEEYVEAENLGFDNIILTLYRMRINPKKVLGFAVEHSPFAITMHWKVAQSGLADQLQREGIFVYAHTVNDIGLLGSLRRLGVRGIYTDYIAPP